MSRTEPRVRGGKAFWVVLCVLALGVLLTLHPSAALAPGVQANPTILVVYADGTTSVNQTLAVPDNLTSIYVPLLSAQVGDILVSDQARRTVSYQLSGDNMTVYSLGATEVTITYDTDALTNKTGGAWTLSIASAFNATVVLPAQSTILALSGVPNSVMTQNGSPVISLAPGPWTIGYGLALTGSSSSSGSTSTGGSSTSSSGSSTVPSTSASTESTGSQIGTSTAVDTSLTQGQSGPSSLDYVALAALVVALGVIGTVFFLRRGRRPNTSEGLRAEDLEVLRFIRDKGGKATEAELRERFSLPRTSQWRQVRRLEQMRYVRVTKSGQQNLVELIRRDFGGQ